MTDTILRMIEAVHGAAIKAADLARRDRREPGRREKERAELRLLLIVRRVFRKQAGRLRELLEREYPERKAIKYDPEQPRDERGRWTDGSGGEEWRPYSTDEYFDAIDAGETPPSPAGWSADSQTGLDERFYYWDNGRGKEFGIEQSADAYSQLSEDELSAIARYKSDEYETDPSGEFSFAIDYYTEINSTLRSGGELSADRARDAGLLDTALSKATVSEDIYTYRGLSRSIFPDNPTGMEFTDLGYISTTQREQYAYNFAAKNANAVAIMQVKIPAGSHALYISSSGYAGEQEFLLPRGSSFRVTRTLTKQNPLPGVGPIYMIEAELIGGA